MRRGTQEIPTSADRVRAFTHQAPKRPKSIVFQLTARKVVVDILRRVNAMSGLVCQPELRHLLFQVRRRVEQIAWMVLAGTRKIRVQTHIAYQLSPLIHPSQVVSRTCLRRLHLLRPMRTPSDVKSILRVRAIMQLV